MPNPAPTNHSAGYDPNAALRALRPVIEGLADSDETLTDAAAFQHQVLRPLLKLQHGVLLAIVADFAQDYRLALAADNPEGLRPLTELLARNTRLRATLVGVIVGLLTREELAFYRRHRNELNRRLLDLAQQRVLSSLDDLRAAASN